MHNRVQTMLCLVHCGICFKEKLEAECFYVNSTFMIFNKTVLM